MKNNKINWRIGCSGFYYKEWKEVFYPPKLPQRLWFDFYCKHFSTLELNFTFYQFPKLSTLQKWNNESPDDFIFSLKVPRLITHYKKFTETEQLLNDFYDVVKDGLGNKTGAILFQLPPQLHYSEEMLGQIINSMHSGFANVIEFRSNTWWRENVYKELAAKNISFCGISHPKLPDSLIINNERVYYRFHGVPAIYKSAYENNFLKKIADEIYGNKKINTAFLYFNNTNGIAALNNAKWLIDYCSIINQVKPTGTHNNQIRENKTADIHVGSGGAFEGTEEVRD
jgi:uncharacterized protein YecE (DUF72 family)